jgi:CheY-like chemotaxis protein
MQPEQDPSKISTRNLELPASTLPAPDPETGPFDQPLPWVIEFRVVGTPTVLQAQVREGMILGRSDTLTQFQPDIDLTDADAYATGVSRRHASVFPQGERLMIRDLNSTNGTRLNGAVCKASEDYRLRHGDELMLGKLRLQVFFAVVPVKARPAEFGAPPTATPIDGQGKRVLIVEDDQDVGNVFRIALEMAGYQVTVVQDVSKALGALTQELPDAVVLDLMLTDSSGLDVVRYLRKEPASRDLPILVVSGATGGYQMGQAFSAGADLFLGKPVAVEELVRVVASVTRTAEKGG